MIDLAIVGNKPNAVNFINCAAGNAAQLLGPLIGNPKIDTGDGLYSVDEIIGGGQCFIAYQGGEELALIVVKRHERAGGSELEVRAALSLCGRSDVTESILPEIERAFGWDCRAMTIYTRRGGLVSKLERQGYQEAAKIMRKAIK